MSSYYWQIREELLKNPHDKYHNKGGKERAKKYYQENQEAIKKKERQKYRFMPEDEKNVIRQRSLKRYYKMKSK